MAWHNRRLQTTYLLRRSQSRRITRGFNQLKVRNEPSWEKTGLKDKKLFSMLSSAEAKTYNAHKYKNTIKEMFMGRINYLLLSTEPEFSTNFYYFSIYEQLTFHAQLILKKVL